MIEKTGNDLLVIAADPNALVEGQLAIIERVKGLQLECAADIASAEELERQCAGAQLDTAHAKRLFARAKSRKLYLNKIQSALEAGYVIVPNFPSRTIAIRVDREPHHQRIVTTSDSPDVGAPMPVLNEERADALPIGEGRYVDPLPNQRNRHSNKWLSGKITANVITATAAEFDENLPMPVDFLKPTVIQMTGMTLARKLFDEIAITPDMRMAPGRGPIPSTRKPKIAATIKGDPMVIGRIIDKRNGKKLSFLIAWFIDTKDI